MDAAPSQSKRDSIVSAANLLMVALLKLNRVLVPALLRWLRSRRLEWVRRSSQDIAKQISEGNAPTRLCVGSCCRGISYDTFSSTHAWAEKTDHQTTAHDTGADAPTSNNENEHLLPQAESTVSNKSTLDENDRRFCLLVAQEERHRANRMLPLVYTSVLTVYFTVGTLILYSAIIIGVVLTMFPFENWEAVVFSFSLVATATISESETLMQSRRKRAAPGAHLADPAASRPINLAEPLGRTGAASIANIAGGTAVGGVASGSTGVDDNKADPKVGIQSPEGQIPLNLRTGAGGAGVPPGAPMGSVVDVEDFSDLEK